jgi:drug/metabolite transporter (DMT)-like permease
MFRSPLGAALLLAAVVVSWGAIPLIVRGDVPWQQLVAARVWLGAITLLIILGVQGKLRVPVQHRRRVALSGVILAAHWASFFLSLTETTVAIALAVLYLGPVVASAVAPRVLGERPSRQVYVGLALALIGVLAVVRPGGETSAIGLAAAMFSAFTLALLMLVAKPAAAALGGLTVATGELVVASLVTSPWALQAVRESSEFWPELLVLGAILTGIAGWIFWGAMRQLPVAFVSVIMYLEPASAIVWAMIFLDEAPDVLAWAGIALVLAGGILAGMRATRAEEAVGVPAAL